MIQLKCPSCGNVYDAKDSVTGRMTKCPSCKSRFEAHPYDSSSVEREEQCRGMAIAIKCPACSQKYEADNSFVGQWITCQACGEKFYLEDWKTCCMSCHKWFNVQDYEGATKCPHCGQTTGKHTPEEIAGWDISKKNKAVAAENARKAEKRKLIWQSFVMLAVLALIVWGLVSCFRSCRDSVRATEERLAVEGDIYKAETLCEKKLKSELLSPSTAKITYEQKQRRADGFFVFSGYIDGTNAFGATIRNRFAVVISYNPDKKEYHVEACDVTP